MKRKLRNTEPPVSSIHAAGTQRGTRTRPPMPFWRAITGSPQPNTASAVLDMGPQVIHMRPLTAWSPQAIATMYHRTNDEEKGVWTNNERIPVYVLDADERDREDDCKFEVRFRGTNAGLKLFLTDGSLSKLPLVFTLVGSRDSERIECSECDKLI